MSTSAMPGPIEPSPPTSPGSPAVPGQTSPGEPVEPRPPAGSTRSEGLAPPTRPKRADARRNYDRLIAAAEQAFAEDGPSASLDGIAKAAGVGPGTLYRNFPTRRALLDAVYHERIAALCQLGRDFNTENSPDEALSRWLQRVIAHTMAYQGLKDVLMADPEDDGRPVDFSWCAAQMRATSAMLLERAQAEGTVSIDVQAVDLLRLVHGVVLSTGHLSESERAATGDRLLNLVLNGIRVRAAAD
jgi:AcrR family transcriptional regulator